MQAVFRAAWPGDNGPREDLNASSKGQAGDRRVSTGEKHDHNQNSRQGVPETSTGDDGKDSVDRARLGEKKGGVRGLRLRTTYRSSDGPVAAFDVPGRTELWGGTVGNRVLGTDWTIDGITFDPPEVALRGPAGATVRVAKGETVAR